MTSTGVTRMATVFTTDACDVAGGVEVVESGSEIPLVIGVQTVRYSSEDGSLQAK